MHQKSGPELISDCRTFAIAEYSLTVLNKNSSIYRRHQNSPNDSQFLLGRSHYTNEDASRGARTPLTSKSSSSSSNEWHRAEYCRPLPTPVKQSTQLKRQGCSGSSVRQLIPGHILVTQVYCTSPVCKAIATITATAKAFRFKINIPHPVSSHLLLHSIDTEHGHLKALSPPPENELAWRLHYFDFD